MENTLSFKRVLLLLKCYWIDSKKLLLLGLGITVGVLVFLFYININWEIGIFKNNIQFNLFYFGQIVIGILAVYFVFKHYSTKNAAISVLLLPATTVEKLLSGVLICIIIIPLTYASMFFSIDTILVGILNSYRQAHFVLNTTDNGIEIKNTPYFLQLVANPSSLMPIGEFCFFSSIGTMIGMIHFSKQALAKTIAIGTLFIVSYIFMFLAFFKIFISSLFENGKVMEVEGHAKVVSLIYYQINNYLFLGVLPIILLFVAYLKLKEKQV